MSSSSITPDAKGRVVLPSYVVPTRYDLQLTPDFGTFSFAGVCHVTFRVDATKLNETNHQEIMLHAKELSIASASYVVVSDGTPSTPVPATELHVHLKATTVKFIFETGIPLDAKQVRLSIHYTGCLNNQMAGFYRSSYTDINGQSQLMASTQFESLDARRCFPCVDEPAAKAVFGVTVTIASHLTALSNMPVKSYHTVTATTKTVSFLDTPIMSTYLLALCVGEFDCTQALTPQGGVLVSVYTPPGKSHLGAFALDTARHSLDLYNDFFGVSYPLPKLDMIAIPEFAMGAMENWGLVTYREVDLLIDPVTASSSQKQRVASVVTHELSHQWFGNFVTMEWWDDLWLNEGFASWAENWAADKLYPDYAMWSQFTTGHLSAALRLDALKTSHPIQVPIYHAEEVEQVFDAISYCKGGSVVRMIKAVLGMTHFQAGLANYMKLHAYGNTTTMDLWKAWADVSGMPVQELMASWTEQMGFPLVKVTGEVWKTDSVTLELQQCWFLADGSDLDAEGAAKKWTIPLLTCTTDGTQADMTLMREVSASITIPLTGDQAWVKLNAGQEVPMRVLHSTELLARLAPAIQDQTLHAIDRAALVNDAYALVKAGHQSPTVLIRLLGNYFNEDDYVVWEGLSEALGGLNTILSDSEELCTLFQTFAKKMVLNLMTKIGWDPKPTDGHLTNMLRGVMIGLVSTFAYDNELVVKEATTRFAAFQADAKDVQSLPSDMRTPVFAIVLKNGSVKEYEAVKSYFYTADDNAERKHVLSSLGSIPDPKLKLATMEWSTSGEIKLQDFFYAMGSVGRSKRVGREIAWQYFQDNLEKIKSMIGAASSSLMDACIVSCVGGFSTQAMADEVDAYFTTHPLPSSSRKIAQVTEMMRANAKFLDILLASELADPAFWDTL